MPTLEEKGWIARLYAAYSTRRCSAWRGREVCAIQKAIARMWLFRRRKPARSRRDHRKYQNANNNAGSSGSLVLIRLWQQQQQCSAARSSLLLNRERWNLLRAIASRPPARPSGREHRAPLATGGLTNPFPTRTSSRGSSRASHTCAILRSCAILSAPTRHPCRSEHPRAQTPSHHVVEARGEGGGFLSGFQAKQPRPSFMHHKHFQHCACDAWLLVRPPPKMVRHVAGPCTAT